MPLFQYQNYIDEHEGKQLDQTHCIFKNEHSNLHFYIDHGVRLKPDTPC